MGSWFSTIAMGWPLVFVAFGLSVAGTLRRRASFLLLGVILALPFSILVSRGSLFPSAGPMIPILGLCATWSVTRRPIWVTWLLLGPLSLVTVWLAIGLVYQWLGANPG